MNETHQHSIYIDRLGGTATVARLCGVRMATVSCWRKRGIPRGWLAFLRSIRPDVFARNDNG